MHKLFISISLFLTCFNLWAQEFNCTVTVNADQTTVSNLQVFRTLENAVTDFINETKWTGQAFARQERINCDMVIIVTGYDNDKFSASLQVQASRPVYGSTYNSPIYNVNDRHFSFEYQEFQPLIFNPNSFDSNLVSGIAFHLYTILGLDAATFSKGGGAAFHATAKQIVNTAAGSNVAGWRPADGSQSRYQLNDALTSPTFDEFHNVLYEYHRLGLDIMEDNAKDGKQKIAESLNSLKAVNDSRPNSFLLRTFFDAKAEEIQNIFSDGPNVAIDQLIQNLNRMAPYKRDNWKTITF